MKEDPRLAASGLSASTEPVQGLAGSGVAAALAAARTHWNEPGAAADLRALIQALGSPVLPSLLETLEALALMAEDPQAVLPESMATAALITHERLADLQLRKLLAQRDPAWSPHALSGSPSVDLPGDGTPSVQSTQRPDDRPTPATSSGTARDWWSVPVEGLGGANQLFILETRELLRGAELSLSALAAEPADFSEQMVMCRAFQAVTVAAASMGLHRLADIARDGERAFDALLDDGRPCDAAVLQATDQRLGRLYAELMELVGEPAPGPAPEPAPEPALGPAPEAAPEPELAARSAPMPTGKTAPEPVPEQAPAQTPEPAPEPAPESAPEPACEPAAESLADSIPEPAPDSVRAPWWWACDWSIWEPEAKLATRAEALSTAPAAPASASDPSPPPVDQRHAWADPPTPTPTPSIRLTPERLRHWADALARWQRSSPGLAPETPSASASFIPVARDAIEQLRQDIERSARVSLESLSVGLYRELRRTARESAVELDFDLEGSGASADAAHLAWALAQAQALLARRIGQGCSRLRLRATEGQGLLRLALIDLDLDPASATPPWDAPDAEWLQPCRDLGGAWQAHPQGWQLTLPQDAARVSLLPVRAGAQRHPIPAAWCQRQETIDSGRLAQALHDGRLTTTEGDWPILRLSALLKGVPSPQPGGLVLFLAQHPQRLALQVDAVDEVITADRLHWPPGLTAWLHRCGVWGAAQTAASNATAGADVMPVLDPFTLQRRFGAAARVLSRGRPGRGQAPDGALTTA